MTMKAKKSNKSDSQKFLYIHIYLASHILRKDNS